MDSFEFNKIMGALLLAGVVTLSVSIFSDAVVSSPKPEKPGWDIAVAEEKPAAASAAQATPDLPIAQLLASADKAKGEAIAKKCASCHSFDKGGANKVGPNLYDVVGRKIASAAGFKYSAGLTEKASAAWDYEALNTFIKKPAAFAKGTAMSFAGIEKAEDRAHLIAYLRGQSDAPKALPK